MSVVTAKFNMTELETEEMLKKIAQAMEEAKGDPKKEAQLLDALDHDYDK